MSEHIVDGAEARAVSGTIAVLTCALRSGAVPAQVPTLLTDAESRRGAALLAESRLAAESATRLDRDRDRLLHGGPARGPIAPIAAPPAAATELARLREALVAAGIADPGPAADLVDALDLLAALDERPSRQAARWRQQLVTDHLLTWGARGLSRMQLGAQTFFYQGVAAMGLGLLRQLSGDVHARAVAG